MNPDPESEAAGHRIRLRGPWEYERLGPSAGGVSASGRAVVPVTRTEFGGSAGQVRFLRKFGRPASLGPQDRIWLELAADCAVSASLNGLLLATFGPGRLSCDVTERLASRNRLTLELTLADAEDAQPLAEASLLIRGE